LLTVLPSTPSTLWGGAYQTGAYESTDHGATWTQQAAGMSTYYLANTAATASGTVMFDGPGGIWRSTDRGTTWATSVGGANGDMFVDPSDPMHILANNGRSFYTSTDGGQTWASIPADPSTSVDVTLVDPFYSVGCYFDTTTLADVLTVSKSTDSGATWNPLNVSSITGSDLRVQTAADVNGSLFVETLSGTWFSPDQGATWRPDTSFAELSSVQFFRGPGETFACTSGATLMRTRDAGVTWTSITMPAGANCNGVAVDPSAPTTIYLTSGHRSIDDGATFASFSLGLTDASGNPFSGGTIAVDPDGKTVYLGAQGYGLYSVGGP
jgi:photosystem II stability/assembly factor-like uncharacterized protein